MGRKKKRKRFISKNSIQRCNVALAGNGIGLCDVVASQVQKFK